MSPGLRAERRELPSYLSVVTSQAWRSWARAPPHRRAQSGEENLQGSWVELHFSNGNGNSVPASESIYNGDMEKLLLDAQPESERSSSNSSPCDSPPRSQTPTELKQTPTALERKTALSEKDYIERREAESILKRNSDWIWDWSSRPENIPHKEFLFKHPKRTATLSMRNTNVMKKGGVFSADFLKVFLPISFTVSSVSHWIGDLHWKASDHFHCHLLMKIWICLLVTQ